jgi:hypothetical protein
MLDPKLLVMVAVGTLLLVNGILDIGRRRRLAGDASIEDGPEQPRRIDQGL